MHMKMNRLILNFNKSDCLFSIPIDPDCLNEDGM
jgi:hypothetical protein